MRRMSAANNRDVGASMPKKTSSDDVSIGKFDILAAYTYAKALLDG